MDGRPTASRDLGVRLPDHGGIEADTAVEKEEAPLDRWRPMRLMLPASRVRAPGRRRRCRPGGRGSGRRHCGAPEGGESGVRASEAVGCFVECAVTAEYDNEVVALPGGGLKTGGGPVGCLGEGDIVVGGQRLVITTRRRAVTDEATEFTMNRIRTDGDGTSGDATPKV